MLKLEVKKMNLFEVDDRYYLAHCISADYKLGAGIAVDFDKKFKLKNKLKQIGNGSYPDCIRIDRVYNLVTKSKYCGKPTYNTLKKSLELMKLDIQSIGRVYNYLAIPKIGCGLDRLSWGRVREIIKEVFGDTNIEILVCYI